MCTATWWAEAGRAYLCFNRDERKTRPEARAPAELAADGPRRLAPIDPVGGGSWICVSERGLCAFLLNHYGATVRWERPEGETPRSRGEIPLRLCAQTSRGQAVERLNEESLAAYPPFLVGLLDGEGATALSWDGRRLSELELVDGFLTTSSYRTAEVEGYRRQRYASVARGASATERRTAARRLHTELSHADGAYNPMMLRQDSRTHSVSEIWIEADRVVFRYEPVEGETRSLGAAREVALNRV